MRPWRVHNYNTTMHFYCLWYRSPCQAEAFVVQSLVSHKAQKILEREVRGTADKQVLTVFYWKSVVL